MDNESFQDLLTRAKHGDKGALEKLVTRIRGFLIAQLRGWGIPDDYLPDAICETEDNVRDKFLDGFRGNYRDAFLLWVRNKARTPVRRILRTINRELSTENLDGLGCQASVDSEAFVSMCRDLQKVLDTLPRAQADVWILHEVEGYTLQETMKLTGYKIKKTKRALYAARQTIHDGLIVQSLVIDIHLRPPHPRQGSQVTVWLDLHNHGAYDADRVKVCLSIDRKSLGQQTVRIPANSTVQLRDFSNWIHRTSPRVITVTCWVGREKCQKTVVVT